MGDHPAAAAVSVVMPVLDAAATVAGAVRSILTQDHPGPLELVIAHGPSTDRTAEVLDGFSGDPRVTIVPNPTGGTSAGLNAAIAATSGPVIARCDAHAALPAHYLRRAIEILDETGADAVGGVQAAAGEGFTQRAIAIAQTTPMGVGDARYRTGGEPGPVDTVYLGVFRRAAIEQAGGFDESQIRNQDYDLNWRIRRGGGVVWFHPDLSVVYRPRSSLPALGRQYFQYGTWKRRMLLRHPAALRWRQVVPPALTAGMLVSLALVATPWPLLGAVVPALYATALAATGLVLLARRRDPAALLVPAALAVMHLSWGAGFLFGRARR